MINTTLVSNFMPSLTVSFKERGRQGTNGYYDHNKEVVVKYYVDNVLARTCSMTPSDASKEISRLMDNHSVVS